MTFNILVLISGNGTNLQAIIDAVKSNALPDVCIRQVISNKESAYGLERAKSAGIETRVFSLQKYLAENAGSDRAAYGAELAKIITEMKPNLVVLAGWMIILPSSFLKIMSEAKIDIINLHPALPGQFAGAHAIERAYEAFQKGEIQETGVMVHKVIEELDAGEVILQEPVPIYKKDTVNDLEERMHSVEHVILVSAIKKLSQL